MKEATILDYILKKYGSQSACASALGWPRQKLNRIVHGQTVPSLEDTQLLAEKLNEPIEIIADLFLAQASRK